MSRKNNDAVKEIIPYLLHWYDYNRRILPWREDPTPYHVWVSEIMLQQTRVEAVRGYYDRFLASLPDVKALAEAEEAVLLKLWEGLGYYNRVRNMQKAARILAEQYDGEMPADYEAIRALPGIGDYTAGAIASIAFGLPYPAVDGNVLRVLSRITGSEEDIAKDKTKQAVRETLLKHMPVRSGDFNQSLMELGATVCLPNGKPLCEQCPVMHLCKAFHEGRENELPVKSGKKERRIEKRTVYMIFCGEKILLHRRERKGLLAGLWEFPNALTTERGSVPETEEQREALQKDLQTDLLTALQAELQEDSQTVAEAVKVTVTKEEKAKHIFSHIEWHMEGVRIQAEPVARGGEVTPDAEKVWGGTTLPGRIKAFAEQLTGTCMDEENAVFATVSELRETYAVPSAFEAYVKAVLKAEEQNEEE